jgi:hypothetical protein
VLLSGTSVGSLSLTGSAVAVSDSTYQTISPALPTISVSGLSQPISGLASFTITVAGKQLDAGSLTASIDGVRVPLTVTPTAAGLVATASLNATSMSDGVHTLSVTAPQTDGLSVSFSTFFSTDAQSTALRNQLENQLGILQGALRLLNGTVNSLDARLKTTSAEVTSLTDSAYGLVAVAVVCLAAGVYAVRRKPAAHVVAGAA